MATDSTSRTLIVLALLGVLAWAVWLIRDVLPPFLISLALALLLDPVIGRMQKWGLPRPLAVAIAFLIAFGLFIGGMVSVLPLAIGQIADLIKNIDVYGVRLESSINNWAFEHQELLRRAGLPPSVGQVLREHQEEIVRYLQVGLQGLFLSLQSVAGALGWFLVVPIVTLYLMIDMDALKARIRHAIPPQHRNLVGDLSFQVGQVFAAYLRGLTMVCLCYGMTLYLVLGAWWGLQYAVILALLAVVLYAVPYLGQLALLVAGVVVAWATGHKTGYVIGIGVAIVVVGQLFDQLITPRVMGKQVGLHPVLGIFALMVGAQLFGLVGMMIAVPAAASIRVVLIELFPRLGEPIPGFSREKRPRKRTAAAPRPEVEAAAAAPDPTEATLPRA